MRRVCKSLKTITDGYIQGQQLMPPGEVEINEQDKTVKQFMDIGFGATRIYLNNSVGFFFDTQELPEFLDLYGSRVTHLRIHWQTCIIMANERTFYEKLTNLQYLHVEKIGKVPRSIDYITQCQLSYPSPLQNLTGLKISMEHCDFNERAVVFYQSNEIPRMERLEYVALPVCECAEQLSENNLNPILQRQLALYVHFLNFQNKKFPGEPKLKFIDFEQYCDERKLVRMVVPFFVQFCRLMITHNVKMLNVPAALFENLHLYSLAENEDREAWAGGNHAKVGKLTISLVNLHPALNVIAMPNLEKITIKGTSRALLGIHDFHPPRWSRLNELDISVDSERLPATRFCPSKPTKMLYNFFFAYEGRPSVTVLALRFAEMENTKLPCPRVDDIVTSCGNLRKLTLVNWLGTNKALSRFWLGLYALEELHLENCKLLGNVAFVGKDFEKPVFFQLKSKYKRLIINVFLI